MIVIVLIIRRRNLTL